MFEYFVLGFLHVILSLLFIYELRCNHTIQSSNFNTSKPTYSSPSWRLRSSLLSYVSTLKSFPKREGTLCKMHVPHNLKFLSPNFLSPSSLPLQGLQVGSTIPRTSSSPLGLTQSSVWISSRQFPSVWAYDPHVFSSNPLWGVFNGLKNLQRRLCTYTLRLGLPPLHFYVQIHRCGDSISHINCYLNLL